MSGKLKLIVTVATIDLEDACEKEIKAALSPAVGMKETAT